MGIDSHVLEWSADMHSWLSVSVVCVTPEPRDPHKQPGRQWPQALWRQGRPLTSDPSPEKKISPPPRMEAVFCASEKQPVLTLPSQRQHNTNTSSTSSHDQLSSMKPLNPHSCVSAHKRSSPKANTTQNSRFGIRTKFGCSQEECLTAMQGHYH